MMMRSIRTSHVVKFHSHLQRQSLENPRASHQWRVKTAASNLRAYTTAAPIQRPSRIRPIIVTTVLLFGAGLSYLYITDTRASIHRYLVPPLIRTLYPDAEDAHKAGVQALAQLYKFNLHPRERNSPDSTKDLEISVFGTTLVNPLGISSGLDKHAEIPTQLLALGPAVVEIGGVTPLAQEGNARPRAYRLLSQQGMLNRYGLNSPGAEIVAARLRRRVREFAYEQGYGIGEDAEDLVLNGHAGVPPGSLVKGKLLAVQVAKNSSTPDGDTEAIKSDYVKATSLLAKYADIIVVNVSCPNQNTAHKELQQVESLTTILTGVVNAAVSVPRNSRPAVMVKAGVDEDTEEQVASICAAVWASGVDGVIVGNTTRRRPDPVPGTRLLASEAASLEEQGGYSGPQLFGRTLGLVRQYRRVLDYPLHEDEESKPAQLSSRERIDAVNNASAGPDTIHAGDVSTSNTSTPLTPKVIFCTGGITNGHQALEVLSAGATVAQIYTALVYGGVGKITSMKQEMRDGIRKSLEANTSG